jgi:hypothetical protein
MELSCRREAVNRLGVCRRERADFEFQQESVRGTAQILTTLHVVRHPCAELLLDMTFKMEKMKVSLTARLAAQFSEFHRLLIPRDADPPSRPSTAI